MNVHLPISAIRIAAFTILATIYAADARSQAFWNPAPAGLVVDLLAARTDALQSEQRNALPPSSFYDRPTGAPGKPGTLIRFERATDYQLPAGVNATRIAYWTRTPAGRPTAASGVVLVPEGAAPAGGWPVIAWAHGTSGASQRCAPSKMRDLQYGWLELSNLLDSGYAIVAADYQGLGMPGVHPYLDPITNGQDVIYAVQSARAAVPALGTRWVAMGHSQGGLAVSGIAELESRFKDPNYLGGITIGGGWQAEDLLSYWSGQGADPMLRGFLTLLATGIKAVEPGFKPSDLLSASAQERMAPIEDHCDNVHVGAVYDIPTAQLLRANWRENLAVKRWLNRARLSGPVESPLLVISSTDDPIIPARIVDGMVNAFCASGAPIDYRRFDGYGLDHLGILNATTVLRLRWIADRFSGRPATVQCASPPR